MNDIHVIKGFTSTQIIIKIDESHYWIKTYPTRDVKKAIKLAKKDYKEA